MSTFAFVQLILAADSRLDGITRGFRERKSQLEATDVIAGLAVLACILFVLWVLSNLTDWIERHGSADSSLALFLSLAEAHKLKWSDRWLLWRVARSQRLSEPAMVFIEPQRLSPPLRTRQFDRFAARLDALGERLFVGLEKERHESAPTS